MARKHGVVAIAWESILYRGIQKLRETGAANAESHAQAFHTPRKGFESAMVAHISSLGEYAAAHLAAYNSPLADDYILGEHWKDSARAFLGMLDGDCGRLDCGTLDHGIRTIAVLAGFTDSGEW